ncbi:MAG: Bifunctional folylpolyglutamate synthase/dihydrofolate synthase [Bacteroidetes bacterium]|nr:Bifunctional folylpolyglutamate synthase/dihydrofolate synthase [Bacteroidota bacterium]
MSGGKGRPVRCRYLVVNSSSHRPFQLKSYSGTLNYLYGLQHRGMKFGLHNIRYLLKSVHNPESRFYSIHVAGTNGKGSTSAFLASIAMEAGYKTGLYTSPHLIRFTERIRIDGKEIPEWRLVEYVKALRATIERIHATFFEATTCIAFQYFADEQVDIAVIEAGLGGRLDSTNVLMPMASVITNIGLDHTEILGKTISAIAREKGGIIKPRVPCVTATTDARAIGALQRIALNKGTSIQKAQRLVTLTVDGKDKSRVSFSSRSFSVRRVRLGLAGHHQFTNAQLALAALEATTRKPIYKSFNKRIGSKAIRRGLMNVARNTGLRGRLETYGSDPRYIMDVAHNPPGVRSLVDTLQSDGYKNLLVVFGVMKDKDFPRMVDELSRIAGSIIAVASKGKRSLSPQKLLAHVHSKKISAVLGGSVQAGLRAARKLSSRASPILVTGSHYVVGEALDFLTRKKA